ncbi:AAA family ATPase [Cellulomonas humilata]|uniref:DNA-binding CsgD family transcriptional regulator n=1 Tax=Cellulomonas humilata TaxID=144055 RepID=A0ABU0EG69_9CELL|nr:helix-turn-helix transcriptional regulator [Cellulomonas humilata]MDQ0374035.1 DNA-binding CsgD family transcriptional regulator [Cellulomonas humilata]
MLVGRERERQVISRLVASARVGESGTLLLSGEAGIGKSALLDDAESAIGAAGMRVLRAAGVDAEREVPFGGLLQLLRPVLDQLDALPAPQAEALGSALALVPGSSGERFAVGAAVLSLLSRVAEDRPLAVIVDDAHLLDPPSAQALCFAARRLTADPVVVLLAARDEPSVVRSAGLPELVVGGLEAADAESLAAGLGHRLSAEARSRLLTSAAGNPLALLELTDEGFDALPPGAPVPVPASLARTFARRADALSADTRTALLVAAAAGGDLATVAGACVLLGVSVSDLDEAARGGLLTVDAARIVFRHDLVRSGVYAEAPPTARRAVHAALARAVPAADVDRHAWHLGEATATPDAAVAGVLDDAATRARARGAWAVASAGYERAARLTPDPADRAVRLISAAESAWRAGLPDSARDLLDRASALPLSNGLRTRSAALDGAVAARTGAVERARDVYLAAGTRAADDDPDTAVMLLAEAILASQFAGDVAAAESAARLIAGLDPQTAEARWVGAMATSVADILAGAGGPELLRSASAEVDTFLDDPQLAPWLVVAPLYLRESAVGRDLIPTVVAHSRRRSDIGGLPILLFYVARDQATTDRWDDAVAGYTEAIQLAREAGQATDVTACLAGLSWLEARRGDVDACRAHAEEALALAGEHHLGFFQTWAMTALAELELGLGRTDAALERYRELDAVLTDLGLVDVDLSPAAEMVEAMVHLGLADEASTLARTLTERAEIKGQPWSMARAARAAGMTCPDPDVDVCFSVALAYHQHTPDDFEAARTELAYGSRLRRLKRRVDSRPHLRTALAAFERLGAVPWADQAAAELRATGETAQRRSSTGLDHLTPQELQVARMLASGRTTRETGAALFLSPKTIEYHRRNVYLKLGIRSREELADAIPV